MYTPSAAISRTRRKLMKNQRRFKAPNYSHGCLLAKTFGVSAANGGSSSPLLDVTNVGGAEKYLASPRQLPGRSTNEATNSAVEAAVSAASLGSACASHAGGGALAVANLLILAPERSRFTNHQSPSSSAP